MSRIVSAVMMMGFVAFASVQAQAQDAKDQLPPEMTSPRVLGDPEAKVTIIEFSSMTCPHCARYHTDVLPAIKEKYIDTGKVKVDFREFPLNGNAAYGAMTARCLPEARFFPFIDMLFKTQAEWGASRDPRPELAQMAKIAGMSDKTFQECMANEALLDWIVLQRKQAVNEYKVESTPTFVVNGKVVRGVASAEEFSSVIEDALAD